MRSEGRACPARRERLLTQGRRAERRTRTALAGNRKSFGKLRRNFPHYLSTLSPPFAASKNSEREASGHRPSAPAPTRLPAPLSASLPRSALFPGSSPRSFGFAPKGPPPGRRFLQADFPHTGGFSRANVERRKRAEGSLLPPFRVCHCQTADAVRSTRVLGIISPERPLPPQLQRLR